MGYSSLDIEDLQKQKIEKRGEARDMFQGLGVLSRMTWLKDSAKLYTEVSRMVTDVTTGIKRNDNTPLGRKTGRELGLLMQMLAQMEKKLENLATVHNTIVKEMDKGYEAVERLKLDMER